MSELFHWDTRHWFSIDEAAALVVGIDPLDLPLNGIDLQKVEMVRAFLKMELHEQVVEECRALWAKHHGITPRGTGRLGPRLVSAQVEEALERISFALVDVSLFEDLPAVDQDQLAALKNDPRKEQAYSVWVDELDLLDAHFVWYVLGEWLDFHGIRSVYRFNKPQIYIYSINEKGEASWGFDIAKQSTAASVNLSRPLPKSVLHERAILEAIERLGLDPKSLPQHANGSSGARKQVREKLGKFPTAAFQSEDAFENAWNRLMREKSIALSGSR